MGTDDAKKRGGRFSFLIQPRAEAELPVRAAAAAYPRGVPVPRAKALALGALILFLIPWSWKPVANIVSLAASLSFGPQPCAVTPLQNDSVVVSGGAGGLLHTVRRDLGLQPAGGAMVVPVKMSEPLPPGVDGRYLTHAAWSPSLGGALFCDRAECTGTTKVLSISLYGSSPRYTVGAERNAIIMREAFPDWQLWVYIPVVGTDPKLCVPEATLAALLEAGARIVTVSQATVDEIGFGMNQRFLPASDPSIDRFEVRDGDSRLLLRDRWTFDEWEESGAAFHIVRDHPWHSEFPVAGGMWGAVKGALPDITSLLSTRKGSAFMDDMNFLNEVIWPLVKDKGMHQNDEFSCSKFAKGGHGFPYPRAGGEHVGGVFNGDSELRGNDVDGLIGVPIPQECRSPQYPASRRARLRFQEALACAGQHDLDEGTATVAAASAATAREGYTLAGADDKTLLTRAAGQVGYRLQSAWGSAEAVPRVALAAVVVGASGAGLTALDAQTCPLDAAARGSTYKNIEVTGVLTAVVPASAAARVEAAALAAAGEGAGSASTAAAHPPGAPGKQLFASGQGLAEKAGVDTDLLLLPLVTHLQWHRAFVDPLGPYADGCPTLRLPPPPALFDYTRVWEFAAGTYPSACRQRSAGSEAGSATAAAADPAYLSTPQYHERVSARGTHYDTIGPGGVNYNAQLLYIQAAYAEDPAFFIAYALPHLLWFVARGPAEPLSRVLLPASPVVQGVMRALWGHEISRVHALRPALPPRNWDWLNMDGPAEGPPPLPSSWKAAHWVRVHAAPPALYWAHRLHAVLLGDGIPWPLASSEATGVAATGADAADAGWLLGDTCRRLGCGVTAWGLAPDAASPGARHGRLAGAAANCIATAAAVSAHMKVAALAWHGGEGASSASAEPVGDLSEEEPLAVLQLPPDIRRDHPFARALHKALVGLGWRVRVLTACDYCTMEGLWSTSTTAAGNSALATAVDSYRRALTVFMLSNQISPLMQLMRPGAEIVGLEPRAPPAVEAAPDAPPVPFHPVLGYVVDACDALRLKCNGAVIPPPSSEALLTEQDVAAYGKGVMEALAATHRAEGPPAPAALDTKDGW